MSRSFRAAAAAIEKEDYVDKVPDSLLREGVDDPNSMRGRFERVIRDAQNSICAAISEVDGSEFHQDAWTRAGGGGGHPLHPGQPWQQC